MSEEFTVYKPDNAVRKGIIKNYQDMVEDLVAGRFLVEQIFLRDIRALYKQSFLGVFWILLMPLITLATFVFLRNAGILSLGEDTIPYPIFALTGLALWQIFAAGLISATNSIIRAGEMIKKIQFSMETLVIASIAQALVSFIIQTALVLLLFIAYGYTPTAYTILFPIFTIPIILLTLGLGFITALLNGVSRDLEKAVGPLMTLLLLATPVMYLKPKTGILEPLTNINPMYYLIETPRNLILTGDVSEPAGYLLSVIFSVTVFLVCWRMFYLTQTKIAERV